MIYLDCTKLGNSGIGRYIEQLIEGLDDVYDRYIGDSDLLYEIADNSKIISVTEFKNVKNRLTAEDALHIPGNFPDLIGDCTNLACKIIVTLHDVTPLKIKTYSRKKTNQWIKNVKTILNVATLIITDSYNSKKDIVEYFGIEDNKIVVTYLYVSDCFFILDDSLVEKERSRYITSSRQSICFINGANGKNKNVYREFIALKRSKIMRQTNIIITSKSRKIKLLTILLGIYNHTSFIGRVSNEDLNLIYNISDIFLFCSLYEGFGLPPLEAMKCKTAVVASEKSCLPEILGDAAVYVKPENISSIRDGINKLIFTDRINEYASKGLQHCNKFSEEKFIKDTKSALIQFSILD